MNDETDLREVPQPMDKKRKFDSDTIPMDEAHSHDGNCKYFSYMTDFILIIFYSLGSSSFCEHYIALIEEKARNYKLKRRVEELEERILYLEDQLGIDNSGNPSPCIIDPETNEEDKLNGCVIQSDEDPNQPEDDDVIVEGTVKPDISAISAERVSSDSDDGVEVIQSVNKKPDSLSDQDKEEQLSENISHQPR